MNPYRTFAVRLARRATLSPGFVRITLEGDDLGTCSDALLDQRVKLLLGEPEVLSALAARPEDWYAAWQDLPDGQRPAMRTYTLAAVRPGDGGAGEVDIDVAVHPAEGLAPGMDFAASAPLGAPTVLVAGEVGRPGYADAGVAWRPGAATEVLLVGDETALPAIVNIAETLTDAIRGRIVVEVEHAADRRVLDVPAGVSVEWRVREWSQRAVGVFGRPAGEIGDDDELLWDEVEEGGERYGWVAGEAGWVRELRAEARNAGVTKGQVAFMGYWRRGAAGS